MSAEVLQCCSPVGAGQLETMEATEQVAKFEAIYKETVCEHRLSSPPSDPGYLKAIARYWLEDLLSACLKTWMAERKSGGDPFQDGSRRRLSNVLLSMRRAYQQCDCKAAMTSKCSTVADDSARCAQPGRLAIGSTAQDRRIMAKPGSAAADQSSCHDPATAAESLPPSGHVAGAAALSECPGKAHDQQAAETGPDLGFGKGHLPSRLPQTQPVQPRLLSDDSKGCASEGQASCSAQQPSPLTPATVVHKPKQTGTAWKRAQNALADKIMLDSQQQAMQGSEPFVMAKGIASFLAGNVMNENEDKVLQGLHPDTLQDKLTAAQALKQKLVWRSAPPIMRVISCPEPQGQTAAEAVAARKAAERMAEDRAQAAAQELLQQEEEAFRVRTAKQEAKRRKQAQHRAQGQARRQKDRPEESPQERSVSHLQPQAAATKAAAASANTATAVPKWSSSAMTADNDCEITPSSPSCRQTEAVRQLPRHPNPCQKPSASTKPQDCCRAMQ